MFREWLIEFGNSGYIARYHYDGGEFVTVLAVTGRQYGAIMPPFGGAILPDRDSEQELRKHHQKTTA